MSEIICFSRRVANKVGINKALLLELILELSNPVYPENYIKLSATDICRTYTFMNKKSVTRWMNELIKEGYLSFESNYGNDSFDHTKSYKMSKKGYDLLGIQNG